MSERPVASQEETWAGLLDEARPADVVEEQLALADVKSRLFRNGAQPVMLSRYILLDRLGAGALGVVYAAFDPELERKVAVKLLRARSDRRSGERLVSEARAMAKLVHPNVITVHDVGTYDEPGAPVSGVPERGVFIVMELVVGQSLGEWVSALCPTVRCCWRSVSVRAWPTIAVTTPRRRSSAPSCFAARSPSSATSTPKSAVP